MPDYRDPKSLTDVMINSFLANAQNNYPGVAEENIPGAAWQDIYAARMYGPDRQPTNPSLRDAEHYLYARDVARSPYGAAQMVPATLGYSLLKGLGWRRGRTSRPTVDEMLYGLRGIWDAQK